MRQASSWLADGLAGAAGAIAGAPQAMGFALIAGVSPLYGLYTAFVATLVGALSTSSVMMTVGPTNAVALVTGGVLVGLSGAEQLQTLIALTLGVGVILFAFGALHLGELTRFVSNAVMLGFLTGAGLLIALGQLGNLSGYEPVGASVPLRLWDWLRHVGDFHPPTLFIGLTTLALIVFMQRTRWRAWATLIAIGTTSALVALLDWNGVAIVRDLAAIPAGWPAFSLPNPALSIELAPSALALAVLIAVQSAALTQAIPDPDAKTPDTNRDFAGQGLANIAAACFQGMPAGGSLSRTAVNVNAGARTRRANLVAALLMGLVLLFLGPLVERVALAALAAQLMVAAARLIDLPRLRLVWRVTPSARAALVITLLATLVLPLEYSIYIGVTLSLVLYVYTSAKSLRVLRLVPLGDHRFREEPLPAALGNDAPLIVSVHGHLYFAAVRELEQRLPPPAAEARHPVVIVRLRNDVYLGSTGIRLLRRYAQQLAEVDGLLMLSGVDESVLQQLARTGGLDDLDVVSVYPATPIVFEATERAYQEALAWQAQGRQAS